MLKSGWASQVAILSAALAGCGGSGARPGRPDGGAAGAGDVGSGGGPGATGGAPATGGTGTGAGGTAGGGGSGTAGIAGTGGAGGEAALPGGVPWEPWPAVDPAPANTCQVTKFDGEIATMPFRKNSQTWEFDTSTRILTIHHSLQDAGVAFDSYIRMDAQGHHEIACRVMPPIYCQEWLRDPLGNTKTDGLLALGDGPFDHALIDPTMVPAMARGGEITRYTHAYDDDGRLTKTEVPYPGNGAKLSYTRDDQLRCSDVRWEVNADAHLNRAGIIEVDHWTYLNGRVVSRVVTNVADPTDIRSVITYDYDADGTLAATVVDGYPDIPQPYAIPMPTRDGLADYIVRSASVPDGSRWIEMMEFRSGTGTRESNAVVMRNGVATRVWRLRWNMSPGCRALALPKHTNQDCEFQRPFYILPLGWDDPYTAPVPNSSPGPYFN